MNNELEIDDTHLVEYIVFIEVEQKCIKGFRRRKQELSKSGWRCQEGNDLEIKDTRPVEYIANYVKGGSVKGGRLKNKRHSYIQTKWNCKLMNVNGENEYNCIHKVDVYEGQEILMKSRIHKTRKGR